MLVDGTEDDPGSVLGDLKLGVRDRGPVVQDHYYVLGLRPDRGDVDRSRKGEKLSGVSPALGQRTSTQCSCEYHRPEGIWWLCLFPGMAEGWRGQLARRKGTGTVKTRP